MNKIAILIIFLCVAVSLPILYFVSLPQKNSPETPNAISMSDDVLLTVGEEKIYIEDLDREIQFSPTQDTDSRDVHIQKLIKDSIILQAGAKEGWITLDNSFFNSKAKNYDNRKNMIQRVEQSAEGEVDKLEGSIVSVWFFNNDYVGLLGYDEGKRIVLEKLQALYDEVKQGNLSIEEAGERIANDTSLATIDPAYKVNAIYNFSTPKNTPITFDPKFNDALWKLGIGQISDIHLLKDSNDNTREPVEAAYSFGQVTNRVENSLTSFDEWLKTNESAYPITYNDNI